MIYNQRGRSVSNNFVTSAKINGFIRNEGLVSKIVKNGFVIHPK